VRRSTEWAVCATILVACGLALMTVGIIGQLDGSLALQSFGAGALLVLLIGVGAAFVARRFRRLERTATPQEFDREFARLW